MVEATLDAREPGVFSGGAFEGRDDRVDPRIVTATVADGTRFEAGAVLATVAGPARRAPRRAGRTQPRSADERKSATLTAEYVALVAHTKARIVDTRKTTPGLRALERAAVRDARNVEPASVSPLKTSAYWRTKNSLFTLRMISSSTSAGDGQMSRRKDRAVGADAYRLAREVDVHAARKRVSVDERGTRDSCSA